jgi:hypothetical protein
MLAPEGCPGVNGPLPATRPGATGAPVECLLLDAFPVMRSVERIELPRQEGL